MEKIIQPTEDFQVLVRCYTYNHGPYIEDALKGFVMQKTDFKFCALIIDDCSTDNTAEIIRRYEHQYPQTIKGVYLKENYYTRPNEKLAMIQPWRDCCKYEAMCEGDDFWTDPLKLQKEYDYLEAHPEKSLVYTDCNVLFHEENILKENVFTSGFFKKTHNYKDFFLEAKYLVPCSWVYRPQEFPDKEIPTFATDGTLFIAFHFLVRDKVGYIDETTCTYRVVHGSASHSDDMIKRYDYLKGVFKTEKQFLIEYDSFFSEEDMFCLYKKRYNDLTPFAVAFNDEDLLKEIREFRPQAIRLRNRLMLWLSWLPPVRWFIYKRLNEGIKKGL